MSFEPVRGGAAPRAIALALAFGGLAALAATPAVATCEDGSNCWTLRFGAGRIESDDEISSSFIRSSDGIEERRFYELGSGTLLGVGAEYHFNRRFGIDFGAALGDMDANAKLDIGELWEMDDDDLSTTLLTAAANLHLTPNAKPDFFIGPLIGLVMLDDTQHRLFNTTFTERLDDEFGFGLQAGLDIPLGASKWALSGLLRYLSVGADGTGFVNGELEVDPLVFQVGLAYSPRFPHRGRQPEPPPAPEPPPPPPPPPPAPKPEPKPEPPPPPPPPAPVRTETIYFGSGSSRVDNIGKAKLDEIGLLMVQDLDLTAHVVGHSDSMGSAAANQARSESRAEAVKQYLVDRYDIDPDRITTEGVGSSDPAESNATAAGRAKNRRAVITVMQPQ